MKTNVMQIVRLVMMIVAVAGIIYALEYMERGIAVWFWITLLGVGFVGLLYTFRLTQRRVRLERRARERQEKQELIRQSNDLYWCVRLYQPLSDAWCDAYNAWQKVIYRLEYLNEKR